MLLAADIGGTKTQVAVYELTGPLRPKALVTYQSRGFKNLGSLLKTYLSETGFRPRYASLAVAGTVIRGQVKMVNLGWKFSRAELRRALGVKELFLLNDLEAMAFAVPHIPSRYLETLHQVRRDPRGNIGVIAAGTGLGEAMLIRHEAPYPIPVATEAGHAEFTPTDDLEWALYQWLAQRFDHVSLERIISGPGIENVYRFLREKEGQKAGLSSAKEISQKALEGADPLAQKALKIFIKAYGREAGNLALRCLATGGIFIGGGIAPKILPLIKSGLLVKAFLAKGRLSEFVKKVPVWVIVHPYPVLLGAAVYGIFHARPG